MWHDDVSLSPLGVSGEVIITPLHDDSWINLIMIIFFTLSAWMFIKSRAYLSYKSHYLSRCPQFTSSMFYEASKKARYLTYFIYQGIFLAALLCYAYVIETGLLPLSADEMRYIALALYALTFLGYLAIRKLAMSLTHSIFFHRDQRAMSSLEQQFHLTIDGAVCLLAVLACLYCGISAKNSIYMALGAITISQTMGFYKQYLIFFSKNSRFLRFFLYLCTLEAIPIALLIGILAFITHTLSTNF